MYLGPCSPFTSPRKDSPLRSIPENQAWAPVDNPASHFPDSCDLCFQQFIEAEEGEVNVWEGTLKDNQTVVCCNTCKEESLGSDEVLNRVIFRKTREPGGSS
jgi:hypothetical protein